MKADELIGDLKESASPRYGVGFIELLRDFKEKELKYKRNDDLQIIITDLPRSYRLFLASVFGALPKNCQRIIDEHFADVPGITIVRPTLTQYVDLLQPRKMFPRRLTSWALAGC